ncbi:MAG: hypothetical protein EZS28_020664, partial [Streblomastix strix]
MVEDQGLQVLRWL